MVYDSFNNFSKFHYSVDAWEKIAFENATRGNNTEIDI